MASAKGIRLGTSAFTAAGWPGTFYPEGLPAKDYLSFYSTRFDTVEVDSTFYGTPKAATVRGWAEKTPKGFSLRCRQRRGRIEKLSAARTANGP